MTGSDRFARFAGTDAVRANLKKRSVRGAVFVALGGAGDFLLRLAAIAVLARLLTPEDFGLMAMVTAVTGVVEGFRDLGLGTATVQRQDITHQQVTNLFWVNAAAGVVFALLLCGLAPAVSGFYHDGRLIALSIVMSTAFVWSGVSVQHEALMSRQLRQGQLAGIRLAATLFSIVLAVVLALKGWGYWALAGREVFRSAFLTVGVWVRCPWVPGLPRRGAGTAALFRFGRDLSLTHLLTALIANIDRLLIGRFFGPSLVGMYRQAQQLLMVPIDQLNAPITAAAQPALSLLVREPDRYRSYYSKIVFLVSLGTVPLGLFVAVYAEEVTLLVFGPAWGEATAFTRIFAIAAAFRPAVATSALVLITCGESARYLRLAVFHSVVLATFLLLGLRFGAEGVAVAHVVTSLVLMLPKLWYSFLNTPVDVRLFLIAARVPVLAGIVMVTGLILLRSAGPPAGDLLQLALGAAVGGSLCLAVCLLLPAGRAQLGGFARDLATSLKSKPLEGG